MSRSTLARCFALVAISLLFATPGARADVRINSVNVISKVPIAKNVFEYVAQAKVQNTGPAVAELRATAATRDPGTVILDGSVNAISVPSGNSSPADTIRFRGGPSAPNKLQWTLLTRTELTLSGVARTGSPPVAGGAVTATVSRYLSGGAPAAWGRPVVENFPGGIADAAGRFSFPVTILAPQDFMTIRVTGPDGAVLGSVAGSAADLIAANGGRANTTTDAQTSRLVISPFSTSAWALAYQALIDGLQSGVTVIRSEAEWRSLLQIADAWAILGRAVYIKTLIENPALTRPAGFTDTFDFATRDSSAEAFRKSLQNEAPGLFAAGVSDLLNSVSAPYASLNAPSSLYLYDGDPKNGLTRLGGERFNFNADGTGNRQAWREITPFTWQVDAAGRIAVNYADTQPYLSIVNSPPDYPCVAVAGQASVAIYDVADVLTRMHDAGPTALLVNSTRRYRYEYVECPQFGSTIEEAAVRETSASVGVRGLANLGFPFPLVGRSYGALFYLTGFSQYFSQAGLGEPSAEAAADILDFNADGTGRLRRFGMTFTWALNASRELDVQFANGDSMHMRHIATTGGVHNTWLTANVSGEPRLGATALIPLDGSLIEPGASGLTLRNGLGEEQTFFFAPPSQTQIDFVANSDGTGCRRFVPDVGPTTFSGADWRRVNNRFEFDYGARRNLGRYYEPLKYVPARSLNDLSTGGWITLENLWFGTGYDASSVPARTQFLRNLGSAVPCGS